MASFLLLKMISIINYTRSFAMRQEKSPAIHPRGMDWTDGGAEGGLFIDEMSSRRSCIILLPINKQAVLS